MSNDKAIEALYLLTSTIIILILIIILFGVIALSKKDSSDFKSEVYGNLTQDEFIEDIVGQNNALRESILLLEGSAAEKDIIIRLLKSQLNMSKDIEISASSRISQNDVQVYDDRIVIYIRNAFPVRFFDSRSMHPLISKNAFALEVTPESHETLEVGDIIGYKSETFNITVVHRIINISQDEQGWYAITKGDANPTPDADIVRFDDVQGVLVGLIY
ncbi:MAG: signal peptidase I [archaeon]